MEDSVADREQKNQLRECFMLTTIEKIRNIGLKQPNWLYERARKKAEEVFEERCIAEVARIMLLHIQTGMSL